MKVGVPKEIADGETRVAATPINVQKLKEFGFDVQIEAGAGLAASFNDAAYEAVGAEIVPDAGPIWATSDLVLKLNEPTLEEVASLRIGGTLISFIWPAQNKALLDALAARKATVLAMDCVPRISRAQKLDALSSMANIAGYRAVVEAAAHYPSFFTAQFTAAGKVPPARVLVIGAGVAGLAAIGAARGLGGMVRAFDTRESVKEQIESMGGEFLVVDFEESGDGGGGYGKVMSPEFIEAEMALFRKQAPEIDICITTALIPGRPAPKLWMTDHVELMKPGSVVVDLAARNGGNCELTVPGEVTVHNGVTIVGHNYLSRRLPTTASQLYGTNLTHLLDDMGQAEGYKVDLDDEVVRGCLVLNQGELTWPPPKKEAPKPEPVKEAPKPEPKKEEPKAEDQPTPAKAPAAPSLPTWSWVLLALLAGWLVFKMTVTGDASPDTVNFLNRLTVFVLSCFVGWQVVWSVSAALHTPLMSVTNAISGIIIVGGMLQARGSFTDTSTLLAGVAVLLATINIAGGFLVTQRMLKMFRK